MKVPIVIVVHYLAGISTAATCCAPRRAAGAAVHPYNVADLEAQLLETGWTVVANNFVAASDVPGRVDAGGYEVTLIAPSGESNQGSGQTRTDAVRSAARAAGLLPDDGPRLM